jgi:uncharacterized protein YndB with AHSA1/START domain
MKRDIRYEKMYPHSPEKIWKLISDSQILSEWLMPNNLLPVVGHQFTFKTKPGPGFDGIVYCEILEAIPPQKLVYYLAVAGRKIFTNGLLKDWRKWHEKKEH